MGENEQIRRINTNVKFISECNRDTLGYNVLEFYSGCGKGKASIFGFLTKVCTSSTLLFSFTTVYAGWIFLGLIWNWVQQAEQSPTPLNQKIIHSPFPKFKHHFVPDYIFGDIIGSEASFPILLWIPRHPSESLNHASCFLPLFPFIFLDGCESGRRGSKSCLEPLCAPWQLAMATSQEPNSLGHFLWMGHAELVCCHVRVNPDSTVMSYGEGQQLAYPLPWCHSDDGPSLRSGLKQCPHQMALPFPWRGHSHLTLPQAWLAGRKGVCCPSSGALVVWLHASFSPPLSTTKELVPSHCRSPDWWGEEAYNVQVPRNSWASRVLPPSKSSHGRQEGAWLLLAPINMEESR